MDLNGIAFYLVPEFVLVELSNLIRETNISTQSLRETWRMFVAVDDSPASPVGVDISGNAFVGFPAKIIRVIDVSTFVNEGFVECIFKNCHNLRFYRLEAIYQGGCLFARDLGECERNGRDWDDYGYAIWKSPVPGK